MKQKIKKLLLTCVMLVLSLCLIPSEADKVFAAKAPTASFTSYYVGAPNEGFKPGDGNNMSVKVKYKLKKAGFKGTCRVRFRVLDSNGKYVYMKLWTITKNGSKTIKWDGKASANNKAGLTAGTYVEGGFYKAEVSVRYKATGSESWKTAANAKLVRTFMIAEHSANKDENTTQETSDGSNTNNTGTTDNTTGNNTGTTNNTTGNTTGTTNNTTGNTTATTDNTTGNTTDSTAGITTTDTNNGTTTDDTTTDTTGTVVQIFTGNKYIDYVAELMIQEAGVTMDMKDDEKVKRIYHYMTTHFNHVHYSKSNKYKVYYKTTTKLKKEITAYGKEMKKMKKAGQVVYDSVGSGILWNMKRRIGECNNHALIFQILCKHVGVQAATCKGYYINMNGSRAGHYWNSAVIDGITYYYDVDVEIQNYGNGQGDYYWYKKNLKEAKKTHEFHSYDYY